MDLPAPTPTGEPTMSSALLPDVPPNPALTIWINETSEAHQQVLQGMIDEFEQSAQIDVQLMFVRSSLLPRLMETAIISGTIPDIVLHPIAYTMGWAADGILDVATTSDIIRQIGLESFDPMALRLVEVDGSSAATSYAAIPSDGYQQLLIYRRDWQGEMGLQPPGDFEAMMLMAETFFDSDALISGFVVPTEANLVTTHQVFEHLAIANGCQLIDDKGAVLILEAQCQEALDFYFRIINQYSPIGVQTEVSAQNAYLAGQTGMIMTGPDILPKLAGLDRDWFPSCPECSGETGYLAANTGVLTRLKGLDPESNAARFGEINVLGITPHADAESAAAFAHYWFEPGYNKWLSVNPERKVPMRWGNENRSREFIESWGTFPIAGSDLSLIDLYGEELVMQLRDGIADSGRWALRQGQGALLTAMIKEYTLPVVLQEMLSGYFGVNQTLSEMYVRITDLIPNYAYYSDVEPAAEPDAGAQGSP